MIDPLYVRSNDRRSEVRIDSKITRSGNVPFFFPFFFDFNQDANIPLSHIGPHRRSGLRHILAGKAQSSPVSVSSAIEHIAGTSSSKPIELHHSGHVGSISRQASAENAS